MRFLAKMAFMAVVAALATGCAGLQEHKAGNCAPCAKSEGEAKPGCDYDGESRTLFNWAVCKDDEKKEGGECASNGNGHENGNGVKPASFTSPLAPSGQIRLVQDTSPIVENGNTRGMANILTGNGGNSDQKEEEDNLVTDRPDFTEASSTVGKGRIQLEVGYTYFRDRESGVTTHAHSYPEILTRIGINGWMELRIGQNFLSESVRPRSAGNGASGATDLYLGTKIGLTEQKGIFPEMAMIFQTTVPTGSRTFTTNKVLPGVSLLYSWDLSERFSLAGSFIGNKAVDDNGHGYTELANSLSFGTSITEKFGNYIEYFAFYPHSGSAPGLKPRYFMNSGFTYLVNPNMQLDIRAGVGLNKAADDFFIGSGLAVRY